MLCFVLPRCFAEWLCQGLTNVAVPTPFASGDFKTLHWLRAMSILAFMNEFQIMVNPLGLDHPAQRACSIAASGSMSNCIREVIGGMRDLIELRQFSGDGKSLCLPTLWFR